MITKIPMIYSSQLKNANERTFISILWLLSSYNNSPAFFSKEYVSYIGSNRVFDSLITTLTQRNIISYFVKGVGASKHRYFTIIDPAILEELKHIKNQKQTKPQKETQNKSFKECDEEKQQQQLELNFNSVLESMKKISKEIQTYCFSDSELQENAQSYLDKSQLYNAYKGKPTEAKLKAWLKNSIRFRQEKPKTNKTAEHEIDWEGAAERLQRIREIEEKYDREYNEPVEADYYQIMDELEDKNTSA